MANAPMYQDPNQPHPAGMTAQGNIDLRSLPLIKNPDGSSSTVYSTGITDENPQSKNFNKSVLLRGILNGKKTDDIAALRREYYKTGNNLGVFDTPESSDRYGQTLHENWSTGKIPGVAMEAGWLPNISPPDVKMSPMSIMDLVRALSRLK